MPRSVIAAAALAVLAACQSHNLDPVQPGSFQVTDTFVPIQGHRLPPNLMFVVDRSGSFTDGSDGTAQACARSDNTYTGDRSQDCKWNNLLDAMVGPEDGGPGFVAEVDQALTLSGDRARLGLVTYSDLEGGTACSAGRLRVAIPTGPDSTVEPIRQALLNTVPAGATPSAATIATLPGYFPAPEVGRDSYAILLTDGAPNCSAALTPTEAGCGGDRCTIPGGCGAWATCLCNPDVSSQAAQACLDEDALVQSIAALADGGIKTFVVGFGADTLHGSAHDTLNRAAQAGGVPRTNTPGFDYYQASNLDDLREALLGILILIGQRCEYRLDAPPASNQALEVIVTASGAPACAHDADCPTGLCAGPDDDRRCARVLGTDEVALQDSSVTILDAPPQGACQTILSANAAQPARVEFRYLAR